MPLFKLYSLNKMNKTLNIKPFELRKIHLKKQMEVLFPRYINVQGHVISMFKKTFINNLDDIVRNLIECGSKQQEKHFKYLDSETKVYLLLSIFHKTKEQVAECYDCISNDADLDYLNFYNRHFSNNWPSNNIEYLMHLIVCNTQNYNNRMFNIADTYNTTPTAPGEFVVFIIN